MITLHTMPDIGWGRLAPSPFCAKVELYLRLAGIPYRRAPSLTTQGAPRGKLPWIEDGAERISDSERIIAHLQRGHGDPLGDLAGPAARRHRQHALRRLAEESLYFCLVAERWTDPEVAPHYRRDLLAGLPTLARPLVGAMASRMLKRQLWEQGAGRRPLPERMEEARADIAALAAALEGPYYAGEAPGAIDCALWGSLINLWHRPVQGGLRQIVGEHPGLVDWLERLSQQAGP